jgi:uncharacterized protein YktB (UPF0637 family)
MVELGLAVALGVVDPSVDDPILAGVQVDIQAINHADAFDKAMSALNVETVYGLIFQHQRRSVN